MVNVLSRATGNFLTASTWGLVDAASYLNSETGTTAPPTAAGASARSLAFTPGAITIDAIAIKLNQRDDPGSGTMTVQLWNNTGSVVVTNTTVTVNIADLPSMNAGGSEGGWVVFKLPANVTLAGATNYMVEVFTSVGSAALLYRDATANNWSRMLRTTTQQAPVAGDDMVIAGELTGAGTSSNFTVTMNETAATDYGAASTSLVTPAVAVCNHGTFKWNDASAGNPLMRVSGNFIVYRDGTFNIGTTGTPIPRNSTAVLELDCAADGDFGLIVRNGATANLQGLSRSSGKDFVKCFLNTDEAIDSTSLGVDTNTGWLDNDLLAVASTTRTNTQCEAGTLNGNAGASSLTVDGFAGVGGGLAFAHSGTAPTQAEVILLTRNVRVRSVSTTAMMYVYCTATSLVDIDWAEFRYLGDNIATKRGIECDTTTGSFDMRFSSIYDCDDQCFYIQGTAANNISFVNNVMWNVGQGTGPAWDIEDATSGTAIVVTDNILMRTGTGDGFNVADCEITFQRNTAIGCADEGFTFGTDSGVQGTGVISDLVSHSNAGEGFAIVTNTFIGNMSNLTAWRNSAAGFNMTVQWFGELDGFTAFGNTTDNVVSSSGLPHRCINWVLNGDTSFATTNGIRSTAQHVQPVIFEGCDLSTVGGIKTAHTNDLNINPTLRHAPQWIFNNCKFGAATEFLGVPASIDAAAFISSQRHDQVAGDHRTYMRAGTLSTDSALWRTASPSMRMTPVSASEKLPSAPRLRGIKVAVANGGTVTVSVYVRKSVVGDGADYNGNQPRLILRANPAAGIAADVVLDTAAAAASAWEQLTGLTAAVTDDAVLEFYVDCDGTTGWVNVDDWSA